MQGSMPKKQIIFFLKEMQVKKQRRKQRRMQKQEDERKDEDEIGRFEGLSFCIPDKNTYIHVYVYVYV